MSNNQDTRKLRLYLSNTELTAITSDSERIMRSLANPSFLMTFRQTENRSEAVQKPEVSVEAALETDRKGALPKPTIGLAPAPEVHASIYNPSHRTGLKDPMREMAVHKANHTFAEHGF